eukprot:tig00020801_g13925.t1
MLTPRAHHAYGRYALYRRRKGDARPWGDLLSEARAALARLQARGLDVGYGHDGAFGDPPAVRARLERVYAQAKRVLREGMDVPRLLRSAPSLRDALVVHTASRDREEYLLRPASGEALAPSAPAALAPLRAALRAAAAAAGSGAGGGALLQIVVSDGLNREAVERPGALEPFLAALARAATEGGAGGARPGPAPRAVILPNGRVRAGYAVGRELFGGLADLGSGAGAEGAEGKLEEAAEGEGEDPEEGPDSKRQRRGPGA